MLILHSGPEHPHQLRGVSTLAVIVSVLLAVALLVAVAALHRQEEAVVVTTLLARMIAVIETMTVEIVIALEAQTIG